MAREREKPVVLVTGASGLVGSRVAESLSRGYRVFGFDAVGAWPRPTWGDEVRCDLTDELSASRAFARLREAVGLRIASVVHLAGHHDVFGGPSARCEALNVKGTQQLLRGLGSFEVEQIIFASSMMVMRPQPPAEIIDERSPLLGALAYPRSAIEGERILRAGRGPTRVTILRLAGIYDDEGHSPLLAREIARIYERQLDSHLFPGDPSHGRPFLHLEDCVSAICAAIERRRGLDSVETLLVAEPEVVSYGDLRNRLARLIHGRKEWRTYRVPKLAAKAGAWVMDAFAPDARRPTRGMIDAIDANYPVSVEAAAARLGWSPQHRVSETLELIVGALKRDPRGFYAENGLEEPRRAPRVRRAA